MPKKESIENIITRHSAFVQRLIPQLSRDAIELIDSRNPELIGELSLWLDKNDSINLTAKQTQQFEVLRNKVTRIRGGAIEKASVNYQKQMIDVASKEQLFTATAIEGIGVKTLAIPSLSAVEKMVTRTPFEGEAIGGMYKSLSVSDADRIVSTVTQGLGAGLTKAEIQNSVFGTKAFAYTDGVLELTRLAINRPNSNNSGMVRTSINGVQNSSRRQLFEANSDIISRWMVLATLDGRTTNYCASQDGTVYKMGEGPSFPAHYNCRTQESPIIDGFEIESTRPYVMDTRTRKEREKDFTATIKEDGGTIKAQRAKWAKQRVGQVSDKVHFTGWFDDATVGFQKEYLGSTKYKLWKDGGMKFNEFSDPLAKNYTISQLYAINPKAFKRAGVAIN